jgi:hypothetical protein
MGKCRRSTDTIKYLGSFGSYEECEAACLSYNVGRDRCRSLIYYAKTHKDRKARQTCFALTHTVLPQPATRYPQLETRTPQPRALNPQCVIGA